MWRPEAERRIAADDIVGGLAAGVIGGLVGSWAMNQFMSLSQKVLSEPDSAGREQQSRGGGQQQESPTLKVASAISEGVLGHQLTERERRMAPDAVHYAFGATMGGIYGAATELVPAFTVGRGAGYGVGLWLGADELALPALRLTGPPTEVPVSNHASALAAHLVYGLVADTVRRVVKAAL